MSGEKQFENLTLDPAVQQMIGTAKEKNIPTVWDRYEQMLPQCGFGETGLCCRHCLQGPCRINPFEDGQETGICGATADVMVARGVDRAIAAGTAAHSGHAKHLAHTLYKLSQGQTEDFKISDPVKLKAVANRLNIDTDDRDDMDIARDVALAALADFHEKQTPVMWAAGVVTPGRVKVLSNLGLVPKGIDHEVAEIMHRTLYGVNADPVNLLLAECMGTKAITTMDIYKITGAEQLPWNRCIGLLYLLAPDTVGFCGKTGFIGNLCPHRQDDGKYRDHTPDFHRVCLLLQRHFESKGHGHLERSFSVRLVCCIISYCMIVNYLKSSLQG